MQGVKLRAIREAKGLTIEELAGLVDYSWSQIQRMEKGRQKVSKRMVLWLKTRKWIK